MRNGANGFFAGGWKRVRLWRRCKALKRWTGCLKAPSCSLPVPIGVVRGLSYSTLLCNAVLCHGRCHKRETAAAYYGW